MINFCRTNCISQTTFDFKTDNNNYNNYNAKGEDSWSITESEKKCMKHCAGKYFQQTQIFDGINTSLLKQHGMNMFVLNEQNKAAMKKMLSLIISSVTSSSSSPSAVPFNTKV